MKIIKATKQYEEWLKERIPVIEADLDKKHSRMSSGIHDFLRATFYRWMQLWPDYCKKLKKAPVVWAVGDLHTENFGTWRDAEGRLVWGINDFDEAYPLPYTLDLVRLATSAGIVLIEDYGWKFEDLCAAILAGYEQGLLERGQPYVLAENNEWLGELVSENLKGPDKFWDKLEAFPALTESVPDEVRLAIVAALPKKKLPFTLAHRIAGLGSLGRPRYLALISYCRSKCAREAKEMTDSAVVWALGEKGDGQTLYRKILYSAVRCRDPFLQVHGKWVVRRLTPDYVRIDLSEDLQESQVYEVLYAMGLETANIHYGSGRDAIKQVKADLSDRDEDWLAKAAEDMLQATVDDWDDWLDENPSQEADDESTE